MKHKSTKSALLMSFTSLLLCFAMLIGTTFAWFTDSVTSGVNQIKAGNLDIEVSYKDADTWKSIQDVGTLFNPNALWEPGHTEYVTLKIENKGTLALKYQMKVSPVSESGGINVAGESFKLSDYLMFGVTDAATTLPTYDRATARNAVSETTKLNAITKSGTMAASAEAQYVTLVVYMPETVGNEANYKTGTAAPFINLGITVLATQVENEKDSFDENYDKDLTNDASVIYNYFPQVSQSAQLVKADDVAAKGDSDPQVTAANNKITITSAAKVGEGTDAPVAASVTFGNNAVNFGANNAATVTLNVKKTEASAANITAETDALQAGTREKVSYDVNVAITGADDVAFAEDALLEVKMFVGQHKTNLKLYHGTVEMHDDGTTLETKADHFVYNAATGFVTMNVNHFSDFFAIYDSPVAAIGTTAYYSLESAVAAAKAGETVVLLKDCAGNGIKVLSGKNFTIDFNGFTYNINGALVGSTGTETQAFQLLKGSTLTFKNGTLTSNMAQILIQNYCNLTLENMVLDGTNLVGFKYALSNNCGNTIIKNTTINAASNGVAFDSCKFSSYEIPTVTVTNSTINGKIELSGGKLNITSGTVNGEIGTATSYAAGDCSITGGTFSSDPSAYVKAPYEAKQTGNVWTIEKVYAAQIGDTKYETLEEALNAAKDDDTVTLLADVSKTNANGNVFTISKSITLDGNNKTITITGNGASRGIQLKANGGNKTATIKNLTIETTGVGKTIGFDKEETEYTFGGTLDNVTVIGQGVGVHTKGYADVEIKNCTINITTAAEYTAHNRSGVSAGPGQTTTISNTNVTVTANDRVDNDIKTWGKAIYVGCNDVENGGKVVINSGEIKGDFALAIDGTKYDYTGKPATSTNTIIANGGHYTGAIGSPSGNSWKELYLKGGTFDELAVAAYGFGTSKEDTSYLEITGGTFSVKPDAKYIKKYIKTGYTATESSGVWTVSKQPTNP